MSTKIVGTGDSEGLRKVEKDVLISKKMKEKAMKLCSSYVQEFEDCVRGRTVTAAWKCRTQNNNMKKCLVDYYQDQAFYDECKNEYLQERDQFRTTGKPVKMHRTK